MAVKPKSAIKLKIEEHIAVFPCPGKSLWFWKVLEKYP